MIRFLYAFAWFRWRILINTMKGGRRRDAVERLSRITAIVLPIVIYLCFGALAVGLAGLALAGGYLIGSGSSDTQVGMFIVRLILLFVLGMVVVIPLVRSVRGAATGMDRLRLLPITHRLLHGVEVATTLADPWIAFVVPAIVMFPIGLASAGNFSGALMALALGAAFLGVIASFGALLTFLFQWFLRDRRRAEMATLVFTVVISLIAIIPLMISSPDDQDASRRDDVERIDQLDASLPAWSRAIPSELYGRSTRLAIDGNVPPALLGLLGLLVQGAVLFTVSSVVHRRVLETPAQTRVHRRAGIDIRGPTRLPGLSSEAMAVARVHLLTSLRTVRGKMAVFMTAPILFGLGLMVGRIILRLPVARLLEGHGYYLVAVGTIFSLGALHPILLNQFASDRAGLTAQFLVPISDWDIVRGKAAANACLLGISVVLCLVASLIIFPGGSPLEWLAMLIGGASLYLFLTPIAVCLSAVFPKTADLNKIGAAGNPHGGASLVGFLLTVVLAGPPGLIMSLSWLLLGRPVLTLGLMMLWVLLVAAISVPLLRASARVVSRRRENILLVALGR